MGRVWTKSLSLLSVSTILLVFSFIGESPSFVPYKCQIQQEKPEIRFLVIQGTPLIATLGFEPWLLTNGTDI